MPQVILSPASVKISLSGGEKFVAAQTHDLCFDFDQIESCVVHPPEADSFFHGIRVGTSVPGRLTAGNFYHLFEKRDFYYMQHASKTIGLKMKKDHPKYNRVIVEVDDPEDVASKINEKVAHQQSPQASA